VRFSGSIIRIWLPKSPPPSFTRKKFLDENQIIGSHQNQIASPNQIGSLSPTDTEARNTRVEQQERPLNNLLKQAAGLSLGALGLTVIGGQYFYFNEGLQRFGSPSCSSVNRAAGIYALQMGL
jgi:hypothetical protein